MSRITSQGTVIMIDNPAVAPVESTITSATKAKPCVITLTAAETPPVVGDIVVPRNTGWKSLDDRPLKVSAVAAQAVTLEDTDTTDEVSAILTDAATPPAQIEIPAANGWIELCRSTFNLNAPAGATIDVTTLCDEAHRIVPGLPAIGTWTAAGFYDMADAAMFIARDAYRSGDTRMFDVRFRDGSGVTFMGTVNTFDLTLGINAAVANNIGGNVDGIVSFYKTPAPGFVPRSTPVRTVRGGAGAMPSTDGRVPAQPAPAPVSA
jgi:hypothetical protein